MAEEQPTVETFPPPPGFYEHFTEANLERLDALNSHLPDGDNATQGLAQESAVAAEPLPDELRFLLPPAPPTDGKYTSFGAPFDVWILLQYFIQS